MARHTSFYYSFLVLPADERRAILAVWDFCRAVDDAVDETQTMSPRDAVQLWRREVARCFDGVPPQTVQARTLQPLVGQFGLTRDAFDDVIDGVAMDIDTTRYQTFDELFQYCRRVASAVGMICIRIFRCESARAREYALNLGIALQLTNIVRDIKSDFDRGRVYLPLDDLARHDCTIDDLSIGVMTHRLRRLIEFECRRARDFYQRAAEAFPREDRRKLAAAEIMRAVYFETLRRIERRGYDVFTTRARVPKPRQALIALQQWLRTR